MYFKKYSNLKPQHPAFPVDETYYEKHIGNVKQTAVGKLPHHRAKAHHDGCTIMYQCFVFFFEVRTCSNEQDRETGYEHQEVKPLARLNPRHEHERGHKGEAHTELPWVLDMIECFTQRHRQAMVDEVHRQVPNEQCEARAKAPQHACSPPSLCRLCPASPAGRSPE